jgi:hypothetical protein
MKHRYDCIDALLAAGINYEDACALRRISMTLHRWHELECGDDNGYASFCLTRGKQQPEGFVYDDDGKPFMEVHPNNGSATRYTAIPDRERGALKRLGAIMARYPGFASYVQGDPRGCALYILRPGDIPEGASVDSCYNRGIGVCK